jgi:hypothetical protein
MTHCLATGRQVTGWRVEASVAILFIRAELPRLPVKWRAGVLGVLKHSPVFICLTSRYQW